MCKDWHNAGIILIFLRYNAVGSENCEKCMQILPATRSRMYKVDTVEPLHNGHLGDRCCGEVAVMGR